MRQKRFGNHQKQRCSQCGAVLAVERDAGIEILRGDVNAVADGRLSIVCYRCHRLSVFVHLDVRRPNSAA